MAPRETKRNKRSSGIARSRAVGNLIRGDRFRLPEGKGMNGLEAHGEPSEVTAEQGDVIVEGPNGVAVTLTPEAAEETARRMMRAASEARRQTNGEKTVDGATE